MKPRCEKWLGNKIDFDRAFMEVHKACREYSLAVYNDRNDVTRYEANREFWARMGDYMGFIVVWPTPEAPTQESGGQHG